MTHAHFTEMQLFTAKKGDAAVGIESYSKQIVMDGGSFYQRGSSVTLSLAGSSPYTSTSTSAYVNHSPTASIESSTYSCDLTLHQKVDQLLLLFNEEKREAVQLRATVLELKEQVEEVRERQERFSTADRTPTDKGSYKVPTDISV